MADRAPLRPTAGTDDEKNRRRAERLRSRILADGKIRKGAETIGFLGTTLDLSTGGALVRTYEALEAGMKVVLQIRLPEGEVCPHGVVKHVKVDPIGCRIAGIEFEVLPHEMQTRIAAHLVSMRRAAEPSEERDDAGGPALAISGRIQGGTAR